MGFLEAWVGGWVRKGVEKGARKGKERHGFSPECLVHLPQNRRRPNHHRNIHCRGTSPSKIARTAVHCAANTALVLFKTRTNSIRGGIKYLHLLSRNRSWRAASVATVTDSAAFGPAKKVILCASRASRNRRKGFIVDRRCRVGCQTDRRSC